jgi:hypothetical protein
MKMPLSQLLLPFDVLFGACVLTTKLSVLFFYSRVFTSRAMRIATTVTLVLVVLWGIGNLLQTFLVCHIIGGTWYDVFGLSLPSLFSISWRETRHSISARALYWGQQIHDSLQAPLSAPSPGGIFPGSKQALPKKLKFARKGSTNHPYTGTLLTPISVLIFRRASSQ